MRVTALAAGVMAVLPSLTGAVQWWLIDGQCDNGGGGPAGGIPFYPSVRVSDSACSARCDWEKFGNGGLWTGPSP